MHHTVTTVNFAQSTDAQIIEAARELLALQPKLSATHRRLLKSKKPDVMVAGKFLWSYLCNNKPVKY
jgi:hypothetical protein